MKKALAIIDSLVIFALLSAVESTGRAGVTVWALIIALAVALPFLVKGAESWSD